MQIKNIFGLVKDPAVRELEVSDIADDSRAVSKGSLFFIIERPNFDIFSVLKKVETNVAAYAADIKSKYYIDKLNLKKPIVYRSGIKNHFYRAVKKFYKPDSKLKIIGITGTNGKTSTAYFFYQLLKKLGQKAAFFGTIGYFFNSSRYKVAHTTVDFLTLHKMIKKISQKGINYLVMEVSSHGIAQKRVKGLRFSRTIFTNLSRDHLDYHKTMASYFKTKKSFFLQNNKSCSIINNDCPYGKKLLSSLDKKISYGIKNRSDYQAKNVVISNSSTKFDLVWQGKVFSLSMRLAGFHNVLNVLAALAGAHSLDFPLSRLVKLAPSLRSAEGRFQEAAQDIFIDYAHTPQGLKNILSLLKTLGYKEVISIFGCGGQRDKGKRKIMGRISSRLADFTIITSDNPRGEGPLAICRQVKRGFLNNRFKIIIDRHEAIEKGICIYKRKKEAGVKACLLIAGKGHEGYQIFKNKKIAFKDSAVVKQILKNRTS
ncbi:MAG: UDP-N-acetylmuramoyl-L-alanyl-D-glutamate--2,6-diaminopimelate ligase [Candidatus Omnitrophica bacterium]|nr:UDP-N-acetylmuramoyl-L-alanyl-D-glutamate--2,6-diaminopimelate ligase [Candidatus Omnitrophota bacterium]MCF7877023.1 UDP-N-acetylmuramoyl-L-alanyl-D-glutamate--2,6-diaminopimelate ligase [Candidatus Omnitrophota bacterium]MCF7877857.1 UDP-N-acetylmuramoyl-L-alanyl-D-glutamate--2,6-diaminopimelate ligase [Candidatus Omnitrophota bacterium]MCF7892549.1 UDP-N-acetylmuramoyl-L-alanyl-D-glutamate--2,6-diaminopimelate ligase [Candidatus Omnitrophota bacterium]